jgi:hypothetical protein
VKNLLFLRKQDINWIVFGEKRSGKFTNSGVNDLAVENLCKA